ncbi:MAG: hypothetical protein QGH45_00515 [Myxococcota bacterium]|jgi:hypothetical protein|nr:hypothetical protein [Myxococcota bacterium]
MYRIIALFICCSLPLIVGCDLFAPIEGDWESAEKIGGERNTLEIDPDNRGEATIYFYMGSDLYYDDFDVEVTEAISENQRRSFVLEMEADSTSELDFEMECDMNDAKDELECEGDDLFESYEFEWERD